jgi:hypothetical protein
MWHWEMPHSSWFLHIQLCYDLSDHHTQCSKVLIYTYVKKTWLFTDCFLVMKFTACALNTKLQALQTVCQFVAALYKPYKNDALIIYSQDFRLLNLSAHLHTEIQTFLWVHTIRPSWKACVQHNRECLTIVKKSYTCSSHINIPLE